MGGEYDSDTDTIELSRESVVAMISELLQKQSPSSASPLSQSTIHAVVASQRGDMYKCVDVILDMLADPLANNSLLLDSLESVPESQPKAPGAEEAAAAAAEAASAAAAARRARLDATKAALVDAGAAPDVVSDDVVEQLVSAVSCMMTPSGAGGSGAGGNNTVLSETVRLDVSHDSVAPGDKIRVKLTYSEPRTPGDWVALVKATRPLSTSSYYVQHKADADELEFVVPAKLGMCEFRYYRGPGYGVCGGKSPLIRVGPDCELGVTLRPEHNDVQVAWRQLSGVPSSWSWLAIVRQGETDNAKYLAHTYLDAKVSGVATLAPLCRVPGTYVVRFVPSGAGKSHTAESVPFVIEARDSIVAKSDESGQVFVDCKIPSIEPSSRNWVALCEVGAADGVYVGKYQYLPVEAEKASVRLRFPAPTKKGLYRVCIFERGSYKPFATSNTVNV